MEQRELFEERTKEFREELEKSIASPVLFSFPFNLNQEGSVIDGAVFFFKKGIAAADLDARIHHFYSFDKIENARYESFFGGAVCEILYEGKWLEFCRAFSSEKENISQLIRMIREISDGVLLPEDANFEYRFTVCPKCRRPLKPGSSICATCSDKTGPVKKLFSLVRPFLGWILLSMLLFAVHSVLNVLLPIIQGTFVDDFLGTEDPSAILESPLPMVLVVLSMALVRILLVLATVLRNNILSKVSVKTVVEMRRLIYEKIQSLSVAGISRRTAGDLMNRVSNDTHTISVFLTNLLPGLLEQIFIIIFVAAMFFSHSWQMAVMILLPAPFVSVFFRLAWRKTRRLYHNQWIENSKANTVLHDVFQGVRVVKVFGTEKNEIDKYDRVIKNIRDVSIRNECTWAKLLPYVQYLMQIGNYILIFYAGTQILGGQMTIGELTMYSSFVSLIYTPLRSMANYPRRIQQALTSVAKVFEVIDEDPDVADKKDAKEMKIEGRIDLDGIWFGYQENENVLENVSVSVGPGEMLGVVGRSGVGKSTLINLVMRLYDVQRGAVRIDGVDVRDISQHSLRSQIGVVLQETFLFAGSIYENLAYAKPEATYEEVIRAARLANAHSFIMKLPDGYDTIVGEKGYTLSGGERQRIAIARAILHDPKILILDEATSALDTETEKLIQDALVHLCKDRTTIAIAHRLSTLRNATKILVLDRKTVAEVGTHEELVAKDGGIYQGLVLAQREMSRVKKEEKNEEVSSI